MVEPGFFHIRYLERGGYEVLCYHPVNRFDGVIIPCRDQGGPEGLEVCFKTYIISYDAQQLLKIAGGAAPVCVGCDIPHTILGEDSIYSSEDGFEKLFGYNVFSSIIHQAVPPYIMLHMEPGKEPDIVVLTAVHGLGVVVYGGPEVSYDPPVFGIYSRGQRIMHNAASFIPSQIFLKVAYSFGYDSSVLPEYFVFQRIVA